MKSLLIICCFLVNALYLNAQHRKEFYPGGYWVTNANLQSGDTLHMNKGIYTYISGENLNNVTILPDAGTEMTSGINLINSSNIHIAGYDSITGKHNLYIHNASGIGIEAGGKCSNWVIDGVDMWNVYSCLWFKTDPDQFHIKNKNGQDSLDKTGHIILDTTGWHYVMDGLTIKHCTWKRANFDLAYIGNTDPQGNRTYWVNGQWVHVIPDPVAHVYIEDLQCDTAYRTIMQISGLKDSLIVKNSSFKNAGINSYLDADGKNQGCDFIIGGANNSVYASLTNCTFKNANLNNFKSQPGGTIIFNNNITDSATAVYRIGQGVGVNKELMAAVEFDNPVTTLLDIENNNVGYSNNNVGVVVYGKAAAGSKFSNNKLTGSFQNFTGVPFDTTGTIISDSTVQVSDTIKVKCDTLQLIHVPPTIVYKNVVQYNFVHQDTLYFKKDKSGSNCKIRIFTDTVHTVVADTIRAAFDSLNTCFKCGYCDSIIIIQSPKQNVHVGIMPFKFAQAYNASVTRDEINYQYWQQQPSLIARIRSYNQDSVIININNKNADLSPADFVHDTTVLKINLASIVKATGAKHIVIENENDYTGYYKDVVDNYIPEVIAAVHALQPLGVTVYNGGFIYLRFWYYLKTHDEDFLNTCIPATAKRALLTGQLANDSSSIQKQINAFKNLKGFVFNIHQLYVADVKEFPGLHRMIEYLNKETGGLCVSNEAGSYTTDPAIIKGLVQLAKDENMQWMILYSGLGTGNGEKVAVPINETDFYNSLQ